MKKANNPGGDAAKKSNEARFAGTNWDEPIVNVSRQGSTKRSLRRKVLTRGIERVRIVAATKHEIVGLLRQGYEVRITDILDNDMIRLFPCMSKDMKKMTVTAQTMGEFRKCIADKNVRVVHCGEEISKAQFEKLNDEQRAKYDEAKNFIGVTPDIMVTCPFCHKPFRYGKQLG